MGDRQKLPQRCRRFPPAFALHQHVGCALRGTHLLRLPFHNSSLLRWLQVADRVRTSNPLLDEGLTFGFACLALIAGIICPTCPPRRGRTLAARLERYLHLRYRADEVLTRAMLRLS